MGLGRGMIIIIDKLFRFKLNISFCAVSGKSYKKAEIIIL